MYDRASEQKVPFSTARSSNQKWRTAVRIKYQRGTVYIRGRRPQMWYGRFLLYQRDRNGKEVRKQRNVPICPKAGVPKTRAAQMLQETILKETSAPGKPEALRPDDSVTFGWFVRQRYIPMRIGRWSPAYRQTNGYAIEHYLISHFGDVPLGELSTFEIQVYLNQLAETYSESVVHQTFTNVRAIMELARKQKYLVEDPAEDVVLPLTSPVAKPVMQREQILALLGAVEDLHDLCLLYVGIFCGPRASEAFGLQWKSWIGESLMPHGTAYGGELYPGRLKSKASKAPIPVPEPVRPVIEAWKHFTSDASPEALMFPTFGRGKRKGQVVPHSSKSFLRARIRPIAAQLGIPPRLVTFQVMRRTLGTDLQKHGTLKDAQGALRHASISTTGNVYMQQIDESVFKAVNSRANAVLEGWKPAVEQLGRTGRQLKAVARGNKTIEVFPSFPNLEEGGQPKLLM
jgi:integrase